MTQILPIALAGAADVTTPQQTNDTSSSATAAFGLQFDSLLKIILTQLTYQDPLKPMDNFEFVSQLAQFSQIQQGQTANEKLESLVSAQATSQATNLLGNEVDVSGANGAVLKGKVVGVVFNNGAITLTIENSDGTNGGYPASSVTQVRTPAQAGEE